MFTTHTTKSGAKVAPSAIKAEFVTSGYFGGVPGDPDGGKMRVMLALPSLAEGYDMGPTFGKDYVGGDCKSIPPCAHAAHLESFSLK